jgi:hypothetical protein
MNPKHEGKLRAAACRFRSALESHGLELLPELCEPFPSGWCGDAAPLLSQYLTDSGLGDFDYVCGETQEVDPAESPQSHAWLEQDGFIIDITADQFPEIGEAVMITRDRTWHSQFIECSWYRRLRRWSRGSIKRSVRRIETILERTAVMPGLA